MRHKPLALLALLAAADVVVAACGVNAPPLPEATETIAPTVAAPTAIPAHKATVAPTATRWRSPTPTRPGEQLPTATAAPTAVPTPGPTPVGFDPSRLLPEGPWLVYGYSLGDGSGQYTRQLWIVNEDGSGGTPMALTIYDGSAPSSLQDRSNQLASIGGTVYLVRPERAEAIGIYEETDPAYYVSSDPRFDRVAFRGEGRAGFLTSVFRQSQDGPFELVLHELPGGEIVDRFPAVSCDGCGIGDVTWSSTARYFAFTASLDSPSYNLYVYDTARKKLRRLTSGAETVENVSWSPHDGYLAFTISQGSPSSHLLIYDPAKDATRRLAGWVDPVLETWWSPGENWLLAQVVSALKEGQNWPKMALWSVRIEDGAARWLHSHDQQPGALSYLGHWLDAHRFLFTLGERWEPVTRHSLVLADMTSDEVRQLYCCGHNGYALDPQTLTVALNVDFAVYGDWSPDFDWYGGLGIYLVSPSNTTPKLVWKNPGNLYDYFPRWDKDLRLFTQNVTCERPEGGEGIQAIDRNGGLHCIQKPVEVKPEEVYSSPDGEWRILVKEGVWLQTGEGAAVARISEEDAAMVIWRPDSQGFFAVIGKALVHFSVPDLSMTEVDAEAAIGGYQWLEARDP